MCGEHGRGGYAGAIIYSFCQFNGYQYIALRINEISVKQE